MQVDLEFRFFFSDMEAILEFTFSFIMWRLAFRFEFPFSNLEVDI